MEPRKINSKDIKSFYVLNTWDDETKKKVRAALETGAWVQLGSSALGHTRAWMTEQDGLNWVKAEYGETLQFAVDALFGRECFRLR